MSDLNASIKRISASWPPCIHCGAPVDDDPRHAQQIHYWTEEIRCLAMVDGRLDYAKTSATPDPQWHSPERALPRSPTAKEQQ